MPNDELTPEERLLRVIQNGDGAKASEKSDVAPARAESPATTALDAPGLVPRADSRPSVDPPAASDHGNLKLAGKPKAAPAHKPSVVPAGGKADANSGDDMILSDEAYGRSGSPGGAPDDPVEPELEQEEEGVVVGAATPVAKKRATEVDGVLRVNKLLLAAVLLILALIGIEIWANISARPLPGPAAGDIMLPPAVETKLPPYDDVLKLFEEPPYIPATKDPVEGEEIKLDQHATAAFLQQNVKLVGLSTLPDGTPEALIADLIPDKMHFVKELDRLALGSAESPKLFTLKSIGRDHVVLSDGQGEYTLK